MRISDWSSDVCSSDLPDLTEERRKELAKLASKYAEGARIAVRNVRRDGMDSLKTDEKKGEISEDERKSKETEVQKLTDSTIADIDAATAEIGKAHVCTQATKAHHVCRMLLENKTI